MRKLELAALRLKTAKFASLAEALPAAFDALGLAADPQSKDGAFTIRDHEERGCVIVLGNTDLAQRTARALAPVVGGPVQIFEVGGTNSGVKYKFRAAAWEAKPDGRLVDFSGVELDFDDAEQEWGGGSLEARTKRVLRDFGELPNLTRQELVVGYKRRSAGKPSSPRVSQLLTLVKKARAWEGTPKEAGRVELKVDLAAGGRQTSYCSAAEYEELSRLTGRA